MLNPELGTEDRLACIAAARWVMVGRDDHPRITKVICATFEILLLALRDLSEPVFCHDLWPDLELELLVIPRGVAGPAVPLSTELESLLNLDALLLIGLAIWKEMHRSHNDLLVHQDDSGAEVLIFPSPLRGMVLHATKIWLPEDALGGSSDGYPT